MAVAAVVVVTGEAVAVIVAVGMATAVVIAPGKGFKKNPEKSSPRKKGEFPLGLLI